jgi:superfamily II DNA or RNA helicase
MKVKKSKDLTLHDILSQLTMQQTQKCIGLDTAKLLPKVSAWEIDIAEQVVFLKNLFQVSFPPSATLSAPAVVKITQHPAHKDQLAIECDATADDRSLAIAAAFSLLLEEKFALGLSAEPVVDLPWELMSEAELDARALAERQKRAEEEIMRIKSTDATTPWADYLVASAASGKTYRVALRGVQRGQSYCSCPDFKRNHLGTCKHIMKVISHVRKKLGEKSLAKTWQPDQVAIHARYDGTLRLAIDIPTKLPKAQKELLAPWRGRETQTTQDMRELFQLISDMEKAGMPYVIYPDAEEELQAKLHQSHLDALIREIRKSPATHPLRSTLLHAELLTYQLDGIAFAAGKGRAVLADEMGLGKTIQGVGVAEFLARHCGIRKVLVICPASLKSQWRNEVHKFCDRSVQLVSGALAERNAAYASDAFFTVCNYEQVLRDYLDIERCHWDLIILDEAQRIKNWEAKTSRVIKGLRSRYALVLTGTPLENRLDDLYSVMEFIDPRRLGPAYRFINKHRIATETGKVTGFKNLAELRAQLAPCLLRRTRQSVALDLPSRTTEMIRIPATEEQLNLHGAHMTTVYTITQKKFLTQVDLLRLQRALLMCRMSANSTALVDKQLPGYSSKLEKLNELLESLAQEPARKIILFSEWTGMLNLIEPILKQHKLPFVRLEGSVPQKQRQVLVNEFQKNPECRVFLTTNAGSTGLNLQAADTIINVDLPWNPALLEQRIARAHRMGQKRKVHVYILVTEKTIEENLLATLSAKHELANAVLDPDSNLNEVSLVSGVDELKRRLEVLLGAKAEAEEDRSTSPEISATPLPDLPKVQAAAGQLVTSAFNMLGAAMRSDQADESIVRRIHENLLHCVTTDDQGHTLLNLQLPNPESLTEIAKALAVMMNAIPASGR